MGLPMFSLTGNMFALTSVVAPSEATPHCVVVADIPGVVVGVAVVAVSAMRAFIGVVPGVAAGVAPGVASGVTPGVVDVVVAAGVDKGVVVRGRAVPGVLATAPPSLVMSLLHRAGLVVEPSSTKETSVVLPVGEETDDEAVSAANAAASANAAAAPTLVVN